ncbi:MAG: hypothetical protein ACRD1R_04650 [Acidobacteriota bacterium]
MSSRTFVAELKTTIIDGRPPRVPQLLVGHKDGFKYNTPLINIEQNVGDLNTLPA